MQIPFKLPYCYAAERKLFDDTIMDGLLALGPYSFQKFFRGRADGDISAPSFLDAIKRHGGIVPSASPGGGIIACFLLRVPVPKAKQPFKDHIFLISNFHIEPSYLAFNEFPSVEEPLWSQPIPIEPVRAGAEHNVTWSVRLLSIELFNDRPSATPSNSGAPPLPIVKLDFHGWFSILDTGTSLSYLPQDMVAQLADLYPNPDPRTLPADYVCNSGNHPKYCRLTFAGVNNQPIHLTVPAWNFIYDSFGDGLIKPMTSSVGARPILGLNFFHVHYVRFHLPDTAERPYVTLFPQTVEEWGKYGVPSA
ncbi:hypothetical protein C8Q76DRAFT_800930 [Earliella scabrosa]|nr:hypothetical protein C8Q76DRAFT_800930 [Earliella scabrosa]